MKHTIGGLLLAALFVGLTLPASAQDARKYWVYIGTYTGKSSKGIYRAEFDPATGKLGKPVLAGETASPSFVALHPTGKFLYAVNETGKGEVSSFAIDPKSGDLKFLNKQPAQGGAPCHLVVDKAGKHVLAANYSGGSVIVLPIQEDGSLGSATSFIQHKGSGPDPGRQKSPHAHSINLDKANRYAFVADLGLDKVLIYKYDPAKGTLTPTENTGAVPPASGPRHFDFSPDGKHAYVINEMKSTVTAYDYDADKGTLTALQTLSTLPKEGAKGNSTAEVRVHPSGKWVYGSNRGHNSIAVFTVDPATGKLTHVQNQGEGIKTPRNFNIDPSGKYLLVANQTSSSIVVYKIDPASGKLEPTGQVVEVGTPVCLRFLPAGE
ncbi:MAG: lactonase family protein [Gemmataceae bacterium]